MPLSAMSAASSGGVRSSAILVASTIAFTGSWIASRMSSVCSSSVFGTPATRSRPFTISDALLVGRVGGADLDLDAFRSALADQQVVLALDVVEDRVVHLVAADAHAVGVDDARRAR